jgi:hypothetical protein
MGGRSRSRVVHATSASALLVAALLTLCGCSGSASVTRPTPTTKTKTTGLRFVRASSRLIAGCHRTARVVGYPVPCPTRVPVGLLDKGYAGRGDCRLHIVGPADQPGCATAKSSTGWRGWVFGSSNVPTKVAPAATVTGGYAHLVITASPTRLSNYAKVVGGPAWYPSARVKRIAWVTIRGWRMRAVFVSPETNESVFIHHVVLIWPVGRHTYAVGFHDITTVRETLQLDEELAQHIELVRP